MHEKKIIPIIVLVFGVSFLGACAGGATAQQEERSPALEQGLSTDRTETIAAVHEDNRDQIASCFEQTADDEEMADVAYAEVELRLPASGEPGSIRLLDPEEHPEELNACIEEVFADLSYGEARRGATFYQMIRFEKESGRLEFQQPVDAYQRWGLTGDEIDSVIHAEGEAINACYEDADDPGEGEVLITLAIDGDGFVSRVTPKRSSLDDDSVEQCLVDLLVDLEFDEPRGGGVVVIDYPFPFDEDDGWLEAGAPGM